MVQIKSYGFADPIEWWNLSVSSCGGRSNRSERWFCDALTQGFWIQKHTTPFRFHSWIIIFPPHNNLYWSLPLRQDKMWRRFIVANTWGHTPNKTIICHLDSSSLLDDSVFFTATIFFLSVRFACSQSVPGPRGAVGARGGEHAESSEDDLWGGPPPVSAPAADYWAVSIRNARRHD